MTKKEEIKNYMEKLNISEEEAIQLWNDDHENAFIPEVEEMTKKAKQVKRYEHSFEKRKATPKERKVDEEKKVILDLLSSAFQNKYPNTPIKVHNELEFSFNLDDTDYTVRIIKHRKKKEKN